MVMDYAGCSSDRDLVTFVDWTEEAPNVFINFRDDPTKPGRMNCYNGDSLKYWLNQPENTVAKWVQRRPGYPMDDVGHGGMPDTKYKYIKMYTNEYIIEDEIVSKLQKGVNYPVILDADYTTTERLGNLAGDMLSLGGVHGQLPGYRVYKLKTDKPLELESNEEDESEDDLGIIARDDVIHRINESIRLIFRKINRGKRMSEATSEILAEFIFEVLEILINEAGAAVERSSIKMINLRQSYENLPENMKLNREGYIEKCLQFHIEDIRSPDCEIQGLPEVAALVGYFYHNPFTSDPEEYNQIYTFLQIYIDAKIKEILHRAITLIGGRVTLQDEDMKKAIMGEEVGFTRDELVDHIRRSAGSIFVWIRDRTGKRISQSVLQILAEFIFGAAEFLITSTQPPADQEMARNLLILSRLEQSYTNLPENMKVYEEDKIKNCIRERCQIEDDEIGIPLGKFFGKKLTDQAKEFIEMYIDTKIKELLNEAISLLGSRITLKDEDINRVIQG